MGFRVLKNYPRYSVNRAGEVMGTRDKLLKPRPNPRGYVGHVLSGSNGATSVVAHRLVAEAFIPNPLSKTQVNHKNGIKTDNRVENLEWCTPSENAIHATKMGFNKIARLRPNAIFTKEDVIKIRSASGTHTSIAKIFGVTRACITQIKSGRSYGGVY